MRIRILAIGAIALTAAALAGCGGDDNASPTTGAETTTSTATTSSSGSSLTISETEFKLDPSDPTASAGSTTIKVDNDGGTEHALEIEGNGLEEKSTGTLSPGDSATLTVDLKPGTYEVYCPIGNHKALGMKGTITVNG